MLGLERNGLLQQLPRQFKLAQLLCQNAEQLIRIGILRVLGNDLTVEGGGTSQIALAVFGQSALQQ